MPQTTAIIVLSETVRVQRIKKEDFISLTDIAKFRNPDAPADIIKNWLRTRSTIELLGLWEKLNNPDFKLVEFDQFKFQSGENAFVLSSTGLPGQSGEFERPLHQRRYGPAGTAAEAQPYRHRTDGDSDQRTQPEAAEWRRNEMKESKIYGRSRCEMVKQ